METKQIIGITLLVLGVGVIFYGINATNSFQYQLGALFGSNYSDLVLVIAGGGILATIGLSILLTEKSNKTE